MRLPDIEALLYHHQIGDLQATINLMSLFCRAEGCDDVRIRKAMVAILKKLGPEGRIAHAERNSAMPQRLDIEEQDRGNRTRAYQSLSGSDGLSVGRIRNIDHGEFADNPIGDFVASPDSATSEVLSVVQKRIATIRTLLLTDSGKSRNALAKLTSRDRRWPGETLLHEEIYQDVEALLRQGTKAERAKRIISAVHGIPFPNVKKIHQRVAKKMRVSAKRGRDELNDALTKAEERYRKEHPSEPPMAIPSEAEMLNCLREHNLSGFRDRRDEKKD